MKNKNLMLLIFISMILICSCQRTIVKNTDYDFSVTAGVDRYSPMMSSVPGLPLQYVCTVYSEDIDLTLKFECNYGQFLLWHNDFKVSETGKEHISDFKDGTLYWTPLSEGEISDDKKINITVRIIDEISGEEIEKREYEVKLEDKIFYSLQP